MSPKNLLRPSLGDYLKEHNPASIVASVSGKDRSAICLAGHHGDLALWWNPSGEGFQSCDTYVKELPAFVQVFNRGWVAGFAGQTWTPLFAADAAPPGTAADDREGEGSYPGDNRTFPHQALIPGEKEFTGELLTLLARQAEFGPQGDKLVLELAGLAVQNLNLGADDVTDLLGVSLSGVDKIGHIFGPYSVEVTDAILRLDRDLAVLFALLDERVGKDRWALALTADHGVLPLPESAEAKKLAPGAHRISAEEYRDLQKVLDRALGDAFGRDAKQRALRCHFFEGDLYFLDKELAERKIDVHEARRVAAAALKEVPWIVAAYTRDEVAGTEKGDPFLEAFRLSYRPDFSPDVLVVRQPGTLLAMTIGTTHGTPHPYDQRIPLYFLGPRFAPGNHAGPAGSHDIVPTLLDLVGLHPKASTAACFRRCSGPEAGLAQRAFGVAACTASRLSSKASNSPSGTMLGPSEGD
ncbi:MAG: alkaline phosphatase family protein [Planctomycetota bacterium]